jgi:hypothetical protein
LLGRQAGRQQAFRSVKLISPREIFLARLAWYFQMVNHISQIHLMIDAILLFIAFLHM